MSHPWSNLSREEFEHRRRLLWRVMAGMGLLLFALLVVQFRFTFAGTPQAITTAFEAANTFWQAASPTFTNPAADVENVLQTVGRKAKEMQDMEKAKAAVIERMASSVPSAGEETWSYPEESSQTP